MISIEDRVAIEQLYARHWWAFDAGDASGFAATFAEDGILRMAQDHDGRGAIAEFAQAVATAPAGGQSNHHMSALVLEASSSETVSARSYVMRVHRLPTRSRGNCQVLWSGYSTDRCVKTASGWVFAERTLRAWEGPFPVLAEQATEQAA